MDQPSRQLGRREKGRQCNNAAEPVRWTDPPSRGGERKYGSATKKRPSGTPTLPDKRKGERWRERERGALTQTGHSPSNEWIEQRSTGAARASARERGEAMRARGANKQGSMRSIPSRARGPEGPALPEGERERERGGLATMRRHAAMQPKATARARAARGGPRESAQQAQPCPSTWVGAPYRREPAARAPAAVRERRAAPPSRYAMTR